MPSQFSHWCESAAKMLAMSLVHFTSCRHMGLVKRWCCCYMTTFYRLCSTLLPSVIMKLMTDLCWTYHQNSTAILRYANCSETSKCSTIKEAKELLHIVQIKWSFYESTCNACLDSVQAHIIVSGEFLPPSLASNITPNTDSIKFH